VNPADSQNTYTAGYGIEEITGMISQVKDFGESKIIGDSFNSTLY